MTGGVPVRRDRGDARCDLGVALGEPPIDDRIVEIDAEDRLLFSGRVFTEAVFELTALAVQRDTVGEPANAAGVIVVQVTQTDADDVAGIDAHALERPLHWIAVCRR